MFIIAFLCGGLLYMLLELLWRGRTHLSMGLAGGLCAGTLVSLFSAHAFPPLAAYVVGALIITAVELAFGVVLNLRLGLNVWDYSDLPFNLKGQICLRFSALWGLLALVIWGVERLLLR